MDGLTRLLGEREVRDARFKTERLREVVEAPEFLERFRAWVEAHVTWRGAHVQVGLVRQGDACPVARYLNATLGTPGRYAFHVDLANAYVLDRRHQYDGYQGKVGAVRLPGPVGTFVDTLDQYVDPQNAERSSSPASAGETLEALALADRLVRSWKRGGEDAEGG